MSHIPYYGEEENTHTQNKKDTKMSKNGFEIRLDVLKMAKEMIDQQYNESMHTYWNTIESESKHWNKSVSDVITQSKFVKPSMYSLKEMMDSAQELYSFVSKKD
jgi:hypothetical protein